MVTHILQPIYVKMPMQCTEQWALGWRERERGHSRLCPNHTMCNEHGGWGTTHECQNVLFSNTSASASTSTSCKGRAETEGWLPSWQGWRHITRVEVGAHQGRHSMRASCYKHPFLIPHFLLIKTLITSRIKVGIGDSGEFESGRIFRWHYTEEQTCKSIWWSKTPAPNQNFRNQSISILREAGSDIQKCQLFLQLWCYPPLLQALSRNFSFSNFDSKLAIPIHYFKSPSTLHTG